MTPKDFMPPNVKALYDNGRKELAEAQKVFLRLQKKGDLMTAGERHAYQKLVERRAGLHSAITALERHFAPVRQILRSLARGDVD